MKAFVALAGFLVISGGLRADWSDYKEVSLSEAWAQAGVVPDQSVDTYVGAPQQFKFRVKTVYTGQIRRIAGRRSDFIVSWGKAMDTPEFTRRFENEIQVSADGLTVWLPIQESLMNEFVHEAKAGAQLNVWIMYIGAAKQDRVFLVNDFEANPIATIAQLRRHVSIHSRAAATGRAILRHQARAAQPFPCIDQSTGSRVCSHLLAADDEERANAAPPLPDSPASRKRSSSQPA